MKTNTYRQGRKPAPDEVLSEAKRLLEEGKPPKEVMDKTGLGQTKVYEIWRSVKASLQTKPAPAQEAA